MFRSPGKKICIAVAAFLLVLSAHPAVGKCPAGTSQSDQRADGEWCLFCADGSPATQSFDSEVSCMCGKADCSVTLDGKASTMAAYQKAIAVASTDVMPEVISSTSESSSSETSSSSSETSSSITSGSVSSSVTSGDVTVPDVVQEVTASHGVMAGASLMAVVMAAFAV